MVKIVVVNVACDKNANFRSIEEGIELHEKENFKKTPSGYYAYFAHRKKKEGEQKYKQDKQDYRKLKIERFGADNKDYKVSNVFVIFVSTTTKPKETGRRIVGYYENADVYREPQDKGNPNTLDDGSPIIYYFHSEIAKEYLLDDKSELFPITGEGLMGSRASIWYPDLSKPEVKSIIRKMLSSIDKLDILNETLTLEEIIYEEDKATASSLNDGEQRRIRLSKKENKLPQTEETLVKIYKRDGDVKAEVLENAKGICAKCKKQAPFKREHGELKGHPYLEVHHKKWLSEDGEDTVENAVALCPNCHKEEHYGKRKFA